MVRRSPQRGQFIIGQFIIGQAGGQCQAGNEVYSGTQAIDNPGHTSATVDQTSPPAGVYALGQKAGLVP